MSGKNANTPRLAALIGWPVAHSLSPVIHATWAAREGVSAYYIPVAAGPSYDDFRRVADALKAAGFQGANVTLPHKEHALTYAGSSTADAKAAGAANMLTFSEKGAVADNSDISGFANALMARNPATGSALLLGAGGAARGVAIALARNCGVETIIAANRTKARAQEIAALVAGEAVSWSERHARVGEADIIVNATSLGMSGKAGLELDLSTAKANATVCDIVYAPLHTPLLNSAKARGLATVDGLDMLMRQAVPGYLSWLGTKADVDDDLRSRLEAALKARGEG